MKMHRSRSRDEPPEPAIPCDQLGPPKISPLAAIPLMLITLWLAGCAAPAKHDQPDAGNDAEDNGIDRDLSEIDDAIDSDPDQDALASLLSCGEPGDHISNRGDLSPLEGCERSYFQIVISGYVEPTIPELRSLVRSEDLLHIINAYDISDLTDLSQLEFVGNDFMLRTITELPTLRGLESLRIVKGRLVLTGLGISDLAPLSSLTSVGGLYIDLVHLTSLEGLASLERIDGDLYVSADGISRAELDEFLERVEVTGAITLNGQDL